MEIIILPWWQTLLITIAVISIIGELFKLMIRYKNNKIHNVETGEWLRGPLNPIPAFYDWWGLIKYLLSHFNIMLDIHGHWEYIVKKFGSFALIYVLTEPVIVLSEPELVHQVMVVDWKIYRRPVEFFDCLVLMKPALRGALPRAEGDEWNLLHRIMHRGFKYGYLKKMVPTIKRFTNQLCEKLEYYADTNTILNANDQMSRMTLDVIGRVAFGFDFQAMQGSELVRHAERFMQEMTNAFAYIPYWHILPTPGNNSMRKAMQVMTAKAREVLTVRRRQLEQDETKEGYPDLLHVLLQPDNVTGYCLDDDTVIANSIFFMVAGHESTSTALSWMIYLLGHHPEIQKKGQREVDELLAGIENPEQDDYMKLKYVEMIVKEGLRLYPPAPFNVRKSAEDTVLGGYTIPKETWVFMPVREIHKLESAWKNPTAFDPDRWADEKSLKKGSFLPFNIGTHNCIGQKFAMLQMRIVLATLLLHYEFSPVPGFVPQLSIHFMSPKKPILSYLKRREKKEQD